MAEPNPKVVSAKPKKTAPLYEMVENETGAFRRVAVGTAPRPAIVSAAIKPLSPPAEEVPEELVFNEEGEVTGSEKVAAIAAADAILKAQEEEELVFNDEGEVTGNARAAAQVKAKPKKPERKAKVPKQADSFEKSSTEEKIKLFYSYRSKFPQFFVYTAEGNLQVLENPKEIPPMVIPLRAFGALRPEELQEIEVKQNAEQLTVEAEYVEKLKELREAHELYNPMSPESTAAIVRINEQLRQLSVLRNKTMYPEQWVKTIESVDTRRILLDQPHEERKMGYPVFLYKRFNLSRADAEGHYREHGEGVLGSMEGGTVVLFITDTEDPKTGMFHPATEREFIFNETRYASPYQAYETERFKELEDEKMVKQLLNTRSAKTIKNLVSMEPRQPQHPIQLCEDILESFYTQHKDATEALKATGSARFHMMDKQIGTPDYANALASVRTKLKEKENDAPGFLDPVKNSVITKEEQKKAKVGGIINNFRRRG
jgi:predicted NAD-dependent protein-ADP-ribosyltransferase YbiA (DUF1768 family)